MGQAPIRYLFLHCLHFQQNQLNAGQGLWFSCTHPLSPLAPPLYPVAIQGKGVNSFSVSWALQKLPSQSLTAEGGGGNARKPFGEQVEN